MVMTEYHPLLKHGAIPERLLKSERFRGRYELRADPSDKQRVKVFDRKAGLVAVLLLGNAEAYKTITEATDTKRKTLKKRHIQVDGPTHVADDAGVPTRRFAYFETSRQQLMAALGDGAEGKLVPALRGRYVRHRLAMGLVGRHHNDRTGCREDLRHRLESPGTTGPGRRRASVSRQWDAAARCQSHLDSEAAGVQQRR